MSSVPDGAPEPQSFARRISVDTASKLLDFQGGGISPISAHAAHEQLRGAVALHNILQEQQVAYLADEVGMGKTYVALGALALFRHYDPSFRLLVITPRENIQKKWLKELKNFTARNVRFADMRVRGIHGAPARSPVLCQNLIELVRETTIDPDRDFFSRLTSFSFALGKDSEGWKKKRDQLIDYLPWLDESLFDLRNKDAFKHNFARALNCALPPFDLVIFDEGHNIKGGFRKDAASRNRVLALAFGHPSERNARAEGFPNYGPRARRVLFLSATPLENDYIQLWNQLDVFGLGARGAILKSPGASDEEKRECARQFLLRRVTTIPVNGQELTKNLYRREWRAGGVSTHDDQIALPSEKQRLMVALVQKKVAEVLGSAKFNNSFQIGMLASFESFLETSRARPKGSPAEEETNFDDPDQTEDLDARLGIDVGSVNDLARSYRRTFGAEPPHPKMDAVVECLAGAFGSGAKALVFVRRVASVKELQRKVEERYNEYLFNRLRTEMKAELQQDLESLIARYRQDRAYELQSRTVTEAPTDFPEDEDVIEELPPDDRGGLSSFFAWFFRGDGPDTKILSGATLQKRFSQAGALHSTFFEDNHIASLLDVLPGQVTQALVNYLGLPLPLLSSTLEARAAEQLPRVKRQQRRNVFLAFQEAAVRLLAQHHGHLRDRARIMMEERYLTGALSSRGATEPPPLGDWLETSTFWTALRERPNLRNSLWPEPHSGDLRHMFREQELRRELLSAMVRLGHPFIDLYVLSVNRLGRLRLGAREQEDENIGDLAKDFIDLLQRQMESGGVTYTAFSELAESARNWDLILSVNEPSVRTASLSTVATLFGRLLRAQQPVGGMFGQVNETLVRQFRMPGYPLVLITTDLLQEGEDLHTFCSTVHHYGISWMPSSMEQRVGRVDRVSSQTDRRLTAATTTPSGDQLLQVYYPHLAQTVEVLQVQRVLERLNRFMRIMHEDLGGGEAEQRTLNVSTEILRLQRDLEQLRQPLKTAFPVRKDQLLAPSRELAIGPKVAEELLARFLQLPTQSLGTSHIEWEDRIAQNAILGTMELLTRRQPFTLLLRSVGGRPAVRCVSPVGSLALDLTEEQVLLASRAAGIRVGAVLDPTFASYNLTIEGDVLLGAPDCDAARVSWLLSRVNAVADRLERILLNRDEPLTTFRSDLDLEAAYER